MEKLCQCCLSASDLVKASGEPQDLLLFCFSIQIIDDKMFNDCISFICDTCLKKLEDIYSFKCQIEVSQLKLKDAYSKGSLSDDLQDFSTDDNMLKVEYLDEEDLHSSLEDSINYELQIVENNANKAVSKRTLNVKRLKTVGSIKRIIKNTDRQQIEESSVTTDDMLDSPKKTRTKCGRRMSAADKANYQKLCRRYRYAKAIPFKLDKSALSCHLCSESFSSHKFLVSHMAVHYPNHVCDLCGKSFVLRAHLMGHIRTHNSEKVTCSVCNRVLKKSSLTRHLRAHTGTNDAYACPYCPERFVAFSTRVNHMAKAHNVDVFKYHCQICLKKFCLSSSLSKHVRRCHFQELNATCEECGKGFFDKKSLAEHMYTHTGEKNFQCKICFKSFARKRNLREHLKSHNNIK